MVNNLPAMQETWFQPLGQKALLENGMETHSSILAWRIPWAEEPGGLQSMGLQRSRHSWVTKAFKGQHFWKQANIKTSRLYRELIYEMETDTDLWLPRRKVEEERASNGAWLIHPHIATVKMDEQQGPIVSPSNNLNGKIIWKHIININKTNRKWE